MRNLTKGYLYYNKFAIKTLSTIDFILGLFNIKKRSIPKEIKKILIIKPDHMGDLLMASSTFSLIQNYFPGAEIDVICQESSQSILSGNPNVKQLYIFDHPMLSRKKKNLKYWIQTAGQFIRLIKLGRSAYYDLCLLLRAYGGNLIVLGRLINPKCLIGHSTAGFRNLLDVEVAWKSGVHETQHFLEVLKPIGISSSCKEMKYFLFPTRSDEELVERVCNQHRLKHFVILHPFAGDKRKMMPWNYWHTLISQEKIPVVLCGNKGEECTSLPDTIINLIGQFNVQQLFVFFKRAQKIWTVDSLAGHIAGAAGRPTTIHCKKDLFSFDWKPLGENISVEFH